MDVGCGCGCHECAVAEHVVAVATADMAADSAAVELVSGAVEPAGDNCDNAAGRLQAMTWAQRISVLSQA